MPRLLLVDDDPTIVRLVTRILSTHGFGEVAHVVTGREALEALEGVDIVLLDHQLPDTSGLDVLDAIRARPSPPGVVLITAHGNESLAAAALRRGADDYLAKDPALGHLLPQVIERVRRSRELRKALAAAEQDLVRAERLAAIGEMTVTLHHEINNPLMAAFADVELLLSDVESSPDQRRRGLEGVRESLRRIRDIVRQIGDLREVRSKSYAAGLRMIDLDTGGQEGPALSRGTALTLVPDEDLARIIGLLLRHAGFRVIRADGPGELQAASGRIGVSLVVVHGGTAAAGAHPLGGFTPAPNRGYRVVALVAGDGGAARKAGADLVVQMPFDPGTFTADLLASSP